MLYSKKNLRPCESTDGEKLLFHRWVLNQYVQNAYLQGQAAGQVSELFALCENQETGEVSYYYPNRIRFTDHDEQGGMMEQLEICEHLDREFKAFCDTIPNPLLRSWLYDNGYIAGGAIYSLKHDQTPNDYDVFVSDIHLIKHLKELKNFWCCQTEYALSRGKFQIVIKFYGSPFSNVSEFDFKHNMYFYAPKYAKRTIFSAIPEEYTLPFEKFKYLNSEVLKFNENRPREVERCFLRIKKFRKRGMKVPIKTYLQILKRSKPVEMVKFKCKQLRGHGGATY